METPVMEITPEELDYYIDQQNRAMWAILNNRDYEKETAKNG